MVVTAKDVIYHNAKVWTGLEEPRFVSSFRVRDGRIAELDCHSSMDGPRKVDLGGRFVSPGLIDAHVHLLLGGESLGQVDLSSVSSLDEFEEVIAQAHKDMDPGQWLIATGWSEDGWDSPQSPDRSHLFACGDRPVVCWRMDLHAALVNDAVLQRLSLPEDSILEAQGGRQVRDEAGEPTGLLQEAAAWTYLIPAIPKLPAQQRAEALAAAHRHCLDLGLVAVRSMEYADDVRELFVPARGPGGLRVSIVQLDRTLPLDMGWMAEVPADDWLRITGCKSFVDGTFGSRTARMIEPYADGDTNRGVFTEHALEGRLDEWIKEVVAGGCSPVLHAIGDEAVQVAINAVRADHEQCRATIEHAQLATPDIVDLVMATPGIRLSMQPLHRAEDAIYAETAVGPDRAACMLPLATLANAGARLSFGSDWPVVSVDPIAGMAAAITGLDVRGRPFYPEECLDVEPVLRGYTVEAAEASGLEHSGSLGVGMLADFVLWDHDPFQLDWTQSRPSIMATVMAGEVVAGTREVGEIVS